MPTAAVCNLPDWRHHPHRPACLRPGCAGRPCRNAAGAVRPAEAAVWVTAPRDASAVHECPTGCVRLTLACALAGAPATRCPDPPPTHSRALAPAPTPQLVRDRIHSALKEELDVLAMWTRAGTADFLDACKELCKSEEGFGDLLHERWEVGGCLGQAPSLCRSAACVGWEVRSYSPALLSVSKPSSGACLVGHAVRL